MNSTAQCSGASQTVWGGYDEGGETCKARVKLWLWSKGHLTAFTPTSLWFYRLWQWTKMSRSCYIHTLNVWMFFLHDEMKCCVCVCVRMCVFTSWLMCTDCRLLMWPDWILLAACDTACNTDLCWWANPQFQIKLHHHLWPTTTQSNDKYSVCLCVCVCVWCLSYLWGGLHWLDHLSGDTWGRGARVWQTVIGVNRALWGSHRKDEREKIYQIVK